MSTARKFSYITTTEYLAGEKNSAVKHEYVDGEVYEMAGESRRHNRISFNMAKILDVALSESSCETYFEGVKVQAGNAAFYYPDVVVTCAAEDEDDDYVLRHPRLIVEVLSPSTANIDKREKLIAYKLIESLTEYAIVWQDELRVELHRREGGGWLTSFFTNPEDVVEFASVGAAMTLEQIYAGVDMK